MNKIEQAIRDLQLYIDVKWGGINDMLNLALTALREKAERKLDDNTIEALREHIEALQQENEQLQAQLDEWKYEVKCHMDEVVARDKKIERLKAQVDTLSAQRKSC